MNFKKLEEEAKKRGKRLLIENVSFRLPESRIQIFDKPILTEASGKSIHSLAVLKGVPVTKFTENYNGRVYPRKLWERVVKEGTAEQTLCLADHPDDDSDGSVKNIIGVWKNFRLEEEHGVADLYVNNNEIGRTILSTVGNGGPVGMSSVGFGELTEDEKTVNHETFDLVRLSDAVIAPSQGVYATLENLDEKKNAHIKNRSNTNYKEENIFYSNNSKKTIVEKRNVEHNEIDLSSIYLSNLKSQSKAYLRESKKALTTGNLASLIESKERLSDFISTVPSVMSEEKKKIEDHIEMLEGKLQSELTSSKKELAEKADAFKKLKSEYSSAVNVLSSLKEKHKKANEVITMFSKDRKVMTEDIKRLVEDRIVMEKDIKHLTEDRKNMERDLAHLLKDRKSMLEDIAIFAKERTVMGKDIKAFSEDRSAMVSDIKALMEDRKAMKEDIKSLKAKNKELQAKLKEGSMDYSGGEEAYEDVFNYDEIAPENEPYETQEDLYADEEGSLQVDDAINYMADDESIGEPYSGEDFGMGYAYEKRRKPVLNRNRQPIVEKSTRRITLKENVKRDARDMKRPSQSQSRLFQKPVKKQPVKEQVNKSKDMSLRESVEKKSINKDIKEFYMKESKRYPGLARVKDKILSSRSLFEAVKIADAFKRGSADTSIKAGYKENIGRRDDWLGGRL